MYWPDFHPQYRYQRFRALFTRFYLLKTDKHRMILRNRGTGTITVTQFPDLYPRTRTARDYEV